MVPSFIITLSSIIQFCIIVMILVEFVRLIISLMKKDEKSPLLISPNPLSPDNKPENNTNTDLDKYCSYVNDFEKLTEKLKYSLKDITNPDIGYFHPIDINFDIHKYQLIVENLKSMERDLKNKKFGYENFKKFRNCFLKRINVYLSIEKTYREALGI